MAVLSCRIQASLRTVALLLKLSLKDTVPLFSLAPAAQVTPRRSGQALPGKVKAF